MPSFLFWNLNHKTKQAIQLILAQSEGFEPAQKPLLADDKRT
jgi:hypothetical protein